MNRKTEPRSGGQRARSAPVAEPYVGTTPWSAENLRNRAGHERRGIDVAHYDGSPYGTTLGAGAPPRGPKGYRRSDARIHEDICEALMHHARIDASEVSVGVDEGVVTLEGAVPVRWMKHEIEDLAADTAGVRDVVNRIRVDHAWSLPLMPGRGDRL